MAAERTTMPDVAAEDFIMPRSRKELNESGDALCAQTDPEAFFPEKGGSTRAAKAVCQQCVIREECLQTALVNDERFGIWGGLSERERRKLNHRNKLLMRAGSLLAQNT